MLFLLIQRTVTRELEAIQAEALSQAFISLYERWKHYAQAGGDNIE
jgi:hypothetical protein